MLLFSILFMIVVTINMSDFRTSVLTDLHNKYKFTTNMTALFVPKGLSMLHYYNKQLSSLENISTPASTTITPPLVFDVLQHTLGVTGDANGMY